MSREETLAKAKEILSTKEVAMEYPIPEATLRWMRHADKGPASFKLGGRVMYRRSALEEWIAHEEANSTRGGIA